MLAIDIILFAFLLAFIILGFATGLVSTIGSLIGVIVGIYISGNYFEAIGESLSFLFLGNENFAKITVFLIIFIFIERLFGVLFWIIEFVFKIVSIVPFVKTFNRLGGAILGFFEGILAISIFLYIFIRFPIGVELTKMIIESKLAKGFLVMAKIFAPLLPEAVQRMIY